MDARVASQPGCPGHFFDVKAWGVGFLQQSGAAVGRIDEVDRLRADLYRLLAGLLCAPAETAMLAVLAGLTGDDSEMGQAVGDLAAAAGRTTPEAARDEYHELFIGVGRGVLVPYGSYYLTGFLNEKPLARLRNDMGALGIARSPDVKEPEDHAGALMEMMAGLIDGSFGTVQPLDVQKDFFGKHVASWAPHFFGDLEQAEPARLYRPVGRVGRLFMAVEEQAFEM